MNSEATETASTGSSLQSSLPSPLPSVEVLVENDCYWIHNALTLPEQIEVFGDILERSKHTDNTQKRPCMNPTPKTLLFDGHRSTLRFGTNRASDLQSEAAAASASLSSIYDTVVLRRAISLLSQERPSVNLQGKQPKRSFDYDRYSVGVIRYPAPHGSFPKHIDHCNDPNGWVILLSLGCTARFAVERPATHTQCLLQVQSGDVLVFDPSTEAAILHGVSSILPNTCPMELVQAFGEHTMVNHRYGVQCRTSLEALAKKN